MQVAVIDSGGANIGSVCYALERLGVSAALTADPERIRSAERVILPGVGAAAPAMQRLQDLGLVDVIRELRQPLLGICLGMQLLFERSEEGGVECLGLLPGQVRKLSATGTTRIPHMGWNRLQPLRSSKLLDGVNAGQQAYFVHSYGAPVGDSCVASSEHGERFAALVEHANVAGAQFHPERSAALGARILENFLR
jgi:glutamine amidotransferase